MLGHSFSFYFPCPLVIQEKGEGRAALDGGNPAICIVKDTQPGFGLFYVGAALSYST